MRRRRERRAVRRAILLAPLLVACGAREEPGGEESWQRPGAPAPSHVWAASRDESALRAYAWGVRGRASGLDGAGRAAVPVALRTSDLEIAFGAAGRTPAAAAYLPLDEPEGVAARDLGGGDWPVTASGARAAKGRFGGGLELLDARSSLRITADGGLAPPWTVSFWMHPGARGAGGVLRIPGLLTLRADRRGRLSIELDAEPDFDLRTENALAAGRWNHVAVVWEGPRPAQVRVVLNDQVVGGLRAGATHAPAHAVILGASGPDAEGLPASYDDVLVERRAAASAEAMERFAVHAEPGEHELSLELADGSRRKVTLWAGVVRTPELRTVEDWSSGALRHFAVDGDGLLRVAGHWERDHAPSPPPARTTHPTVFVGDHRVFVFGGEVKDSHLFPMVNRDDTWIYHARRRRWQQVTGDPAPDPRCHQPAAYSPDHGVVLLCGGWRNDDPARPAGSTYADTWIFRVDELRWERREPSGPALPPSSHASLVYHAGARRFLLFIGTHVWEYDPESDAWRDRPWTPVVGEDGRPAEYRPGGSRMTGYDPETQLVVFFGSERWEEGELAYGDPTAVYDRDAHRFVVRRPAASPAPRARSGFAYDARRGWFVLYGGVRDERSTRFDDLWTYRVATNEWRRWRASGAPSRRGGYYGMAYDPDDDVCLLLAGRHSVPRFLDEAWRLRLDPAAVAEATYVFDRASSAAAERVVLEWSGAEDADVRLAVRGSEDAITWGEGSVAGSHRFVRVHLSARSTGDGDVRVSRLGLVAGDGAPRAAYRIEVPIAPFR